MDFWEKIFGGNQESAPVVKPAAPSTPLGKQDALEPKQEVVGELLQTNFTPESQEGVRIIQCEQYKYGKPLQSPRGEIIRGIDHSTTGYSAGFRAFPEELRTKSQIGDLFTPDITKTDFNNPWESEGGAITKRLVEVDGKQYAILGRTKQRPESGQPGVGRNYTEMHSLVVSADEWSIAMISKIDAITDTYGMTGRDPAMPQVEVSTDVLDQPLLPGWLDAYTKDLIQRIVCGTPVAIQDWKITEKEFTQKLFFSLLCLPENVARQASFGVGFPKTKPSSDVRIVLTMQAIYPTRKIAGAWKGVAPEDEAFGHKYLAAVENAVSTATTPREVMSAVANLPEELKSEVSRRFAL